MKDVQCYEIFGGIALKNHAFSFHFHRAVEISTNVKSSILVQFTNFLNFVFKSKVHSICASVSQ